jgi:UDP-N-acetylmuramoylalanine--D-glutamate ligase
MRVDELRGKRVAIWGFAREGQAALRFLRAHVPAIALTVLDDSADSAPHDVSVIHGRAAIAAAIADFDVVVKSPGISLYDPLVTQAKTSGVRFTSLLNLWFADAPSARTICVTGTKGKSTTAALIAHILNGTGRNAALAGNIGIPVTELPHEALDYAVIEVSSYQAADFDGLCDVAVLTMLAQDHLDWHGSVAAYQRDKLNLLRHARCAIVNADALDAVATVRQTEPIAARVMPGEGPAPTTFLAAASFDPRPNLTVANRYLARPHNLSNLSAALAVARWAGIDHAEALCAAEDFRPLPHRQEEIGAVDGVLYVDDSISTTPESAVAALDVYRGRDVTIIIGGQDRGIDYGVLVQHLRATPPCAVVLLGESGRRMQSLLAPFDQMHVAESMQDAVNIAREVTPRGGVVLLSPAAPSYGVYRSFVERGQDFARCAGLHEKFTTETQRHRG